MHWIDPTSLPETKGMVDRFLLNPHGDADGMLLTDGTEIHFPAHMSRHVLAGVKPGASVTVRGVRPRAANMIAAVSIQVGDAAPIVDQGPPEADAPDKPGHKAETHELKDIEGVVKMILHGPHGETCGAILEDGTIVRLPPGEVAAMHGHLAVGNKLAARGECMTNAVGAVLTARWVGSSLFALHQVEPAAHAKYSGASHDEHTKHRPAA